MTTGGAVLTGRHQKKHAGAAEDDYNYKETEWLLLTQLGHGQTI